MEHLAGAEQEGFAEHGAGPAASPVRVGNRVREVRRDRLMTQAELAERARVALRTIHAVERGMNCRADTKRRIIAALDVSFEDRDQVFPPGAPVRVRRRAPRST